VIRKFQQPHTGGIIGALWRWFDRSILALGREFRLSFMPPLMVYMAAGIAGITSVVGAFYVKERLGLSAEFLAALGFWATLPWALKMPMGHLVDLMWRMKAIFVYIGASMIAASLVIMIGLLGYTDTMLGIAPAEAWYVLATLLAPVGYVVQDVVADAMTVEAVPNVDRDGNPFADAQRKSMHTTMQLLGRVAIIGGLTVVGLINLVLLDGVGELPDAQKAQAYLRVYQLALLIPLVSVSGVFLASWLRHRDITQHVRQGRTRAQAVELIDVHSESPAVNWWILGGGLAFVALSIGVGLGELAAAQEIVFVTSMVIVIFLITQLTRELDPQARNVLVGTAIIIFAFRAVPTTGAGTSWWMMDDLGFDPQFFTVLSLIASGLTLFGIVIFRRFMAERSIAYIVGALTIAGALLMLPDIGMYYGLHHWTAEVTNGVVDARFIALIDTAIESPLGQIAMIPMLAWIANSAPARLKATFFAVMASFTNLALSASQLGTKYLNRIFSVTREVRDPATQEVVVPADYSELGMLLITASLIALIMPLLAIVLVRLSPLRNA
jgi:BT1 family